MPTSSFGGYAYEDQILKALQVCRLLQYMVFVCNFTPKKLTLPGIVLKTLCYISCSCSWMVLSLKTLPLCSLAQLF